MKEIDLSELPRTYKGIDWNNSIGYKCKFVYDDVKGEVEIIGHENRRLYFKYNNIIHTMLSYQFINCSLGKIIGKHTVDFKVKIGSNFKDDKRDINITDREYRKYKNNQNKKWYKYTCNKCGWTEGWIEEVILLKGQGCACCRGMTLVPVINDIPTTAPWMVKFFQGGIEEASKYTKASNQKIYPICPDCSRVKDRPMMIWTIYKTHSIGCGCSDGKPYDEKLFYYIVNEQLGLNMIWGANKNDYPWMGTKVYDFVDEENKIIWELDGGLGHGNWVYKNSSKTIEETIEDDKYKDELAKNNGYKVIRIDTHYKNDDPFKYIKNSILKSRFSKMYDVSNLNWQDANKFASKNLIKEICEYYETHKNLNQKEIASIFKLSLNTTHKFLYQGEKFGWCSNVKERSITSMKFLAKKVICIELNEEFESISECVMKLSERFNKKFYHGNISRVCRGEAKQHQGFHFKYISYNN